MEDLSKNLSNLPKFDSALPKTLRTFFWQFIKPQFWSFLVLALSMTAWGLQEALFPYFIKLTIDGVSNHALDKKNIFVDLGFVLGAWFMIWVTFELGYRTYDFLSAKVYPRFEAMVRMSMFEYAGHHSYQFFSDNFAGTIASKITRMPEAMLNILRIVLSVFYPVVLGFLAASIILFLTKPIFALILLIWVILHFGLTFYFTLHCANLSADHSAAVTLLTGKIVDAFSNIVNVRLFSRHRFEINYLKKYQESELNKAYVLGKYIAVMKLFLGLASLVFIFTMISLSIYAWREDWITLGELALVLTSLNLIGLAWYMGMHLMDVFTHLGTCRESLTVIQKTHDVVDSQAAKILKVTRGEIEFDKVTFRYIRNRNVFQNKTLTIKPGQKTGLVGFSGSGKTTFVNLILRYFDIDEGRILIDGQDIKSVTTDSLRQNIALIPQDTTLFHRSLFENIRYGRLDASDEEVIEASKKAHCHEFIERLEFGYDTLVGERGVKLSGGQRQRIAIARAILKNAPILILDEATSSLDSITESYIQESLNLLMKNRTTVVIAHRLSTLSGMDRILVFKDGQVIEDGTHRELLALNGHYAKLWKMQAGGFLPESPSGEE